jgi:hypothetical protein
MKKYKMGNQCICNRTTILCQYHKEILEKELPFITSTVDDIIRQFRIMKLIQLGY